MTKQPMIDRNSLYPAPLLARVDMLVAKEQETRRFTFSDAVREALADWATRHEAQM